jgi:uncharacterized protein involved in outer membrane biogenesis
MTGGKFSDLLLQLIGVDIAESLGIVLTKDKPVPVRCAVADFSLRDGLMKSRCWSSTTTDTKVTGDGTINLRDEKLDLKLEAHPKNPSPLEARTPILIRGSSRQARIRCRSIASRGSRRCGRGTRCLADAPRRTSAAD